MKIALIIVGVSAGQLLMAFIAWRLYQGDNPSAPEDVLEDLAFCFFGWILVIPFCGILTLNDWTTTYVKRRRARSRQSSSQLRSGQDNGLYE